MTDPNSPQNKIAWSNVNIGFDVDKDRSGKYDMTLDEVTADLGPNSADGEDSQDATAVKSVKTKMKGNEIRRFIQSYKLGLYLYGERFLYY